MTSLFCDLVAFTAMSEIADPEDSDALLRSHHFAARKVIKAHGGTVEKLIGDAVVGGFGVPVAHEDDPERAVRAALRRAGRFADPPRPRCRQHQRSPRTARRRARPGPARCGRRRPRRRLGLSRKRRAGANHGSAVGSLIDFALSSISFPVGRVQVLPVHPLSFLEFLWARGNGPAADVVRAAPRDLGRSMHEALLQHVRDYLFVGGMPAAVAAFVASGRISEARRVQDRLVGAYRADFGKYSPRVDPACLDEVLTTVARSVGRQVTYTSLAPDFSHPTVKSAFDALRRARVIHRISAARIAGMPPGAMVSARTRKAILVDMGLMHALTDMSIEVGLRQDLLAVYNGALAEQYVGQELLAASGQDLYYWSRQARGSTAEVDYLVSPQGSIRAVEVKSGPAGKLKSMHLLLSAHPECAPGFVVSAAPYAELPEQGLVFLPLYYAAAVAGRGAIDAAAWQSGGDSADR